MWLAATNGFLLAWEIKAAAPQPWLRLALVRTAMAKADEDRSSKPIDPSSLPIIEALAGKLVAADSHAWQKLRVHTAEYRDPESIERCMGTRAPALGHRANRGGESKRSAGAPLYRPDARGMVWKQQNLVPFI